MSVGKPKDSESTLSNVLKVTSRNLLIDTLKKIKGKKDLVLEHELTPLLDLIAGITHLRSADVDKIYKLQAGPSLGNNQRSVYLVRPSIASCKCIAEQIIINRRNGQNLHSYYVIFVPRKVNEFESVFESEGVYEHLQIMELPLGLIALDTDLFSLEIQDFFSSYYLDGDFTWILSVARSLLQLQSICGAIPSFTGQGRCAKMVLDLMNHLKDDYKYPSGEPQIGQIILMDRDVDYASLLLTQVNYAGLLDETFGIKAGKLTLGTEVTDRAEPVKLLLNSNDEVFLEIRDKHFASAFSLLKWKVDNLKTKHSERKGMNIADMKKFVADELAKVQQQHLSLSMFVSASQSMNTKLDDLHALLRTETALIEGAEIKECTNYIEDCINQQLPIYSSLRLLCLLSLCQDGLSAKEYKALATLFLQAYGHQHITILHSLKKLGLLNEQQKASSNSSLKSPGGGGTASASLAGMMAAAMKKSTFRLTAKKLNLIPNEEGYDFRVPPDPGYVFSGAYIPLVCRLSELAMSRGGMNKMEEALKLLPGPTTQIKSHRQTTSVSTFPQSSTSSNVALVFFLGGVTQAEITALRFLGLQRGYTFLIGTTSVVNGTSFLQELSPVPA